MNKKVIYWTCILLGGVIEAICVVLVARFIDNHFSQGGLTTTGIGIVSLLLLWQVIGTKWVNPRIKEKLNLKSVF